MMTREEWDRAECLLKAELNRLWPGGKSEQDRMDDAIWRILESQSRQLTS